MPVIPAAAVWALGQSAVINARLTEPMQVLQAAAIAGTVDTGAVASALRSIASDTTSGADLSARLGAWPAAAGVAADLRVFYADARTAALAGLGAALSNQPAYRQAARELVAILGSLGTLDARSRDLATTAGITLAPVDVPAATDAAGPSGPGPEPIP